MTPLPPQPAASAATAPATCTTAPPQPSQLAAARRPAPPTMEIGAPVRRCGGAAARARLARFGRDSVCLVRRRRHRRRRRYTLAPLNSRVWPCSLLSHAWQLNPQQTSQERRPVQSWRRLGQGLRTGGSVVVQLRSAGASLQRFRIQFQGA